MKAQTTPRWKRKNGRGVSPIIATILLVAITVVLAAVLYILVTGLIGGSHSVTSSIGWSLGSVSTCTVTTPAADGTITVYPLTVASTTATISTANFGVSITQSGSATATSPGAPTAATGSTCPDGATGCVPASATAWDAILTTAQGTVEASFGTGGTSGWYTPACAALGSPVTLSSGMILFVLQPSSDNFGGATLTSFGLGGASITGSATL
jgi:flagellin-like protein